MVRLGTLLSSSIVLFAATAASVACSGSASDGGSRWDCHGAVVPLGHTLECVAQDDQALTSDGVSSGDGPAYTCAPGAPESAACPPPSAGATTSDGTAGGAGAATTGGTTDGTGAGTAGTATAGGGTGGGTAGSGTGGTGTAGGDGHDDLATGTMDGTSDSTTGSAGSSGSGGAGGAPVGGGSGASAGGGGAATSGGTSDGTATGGAFYCTHQHGKRYCRREPICDVGSHRLQMDCEPDATSGFGSGSGGAGGDSAGGGGGTTSGGYPGAGTGDATGGMPGAHEQCYYASGATPGTSTPAATFEYVLETFSGAQALHTRLTFNPAFVDNSYGKGSVGWGSHVHQFKELVGSDHAELSFSDQTGTETLHFKLDYISQTATAPSGYASLGVTGGEGRMIVGNASSILKASSSLDRNLNERGYASYVVDSPATDASYTPPSSAPAWDYRVVYEAWIASSAFGASGFGSVKLTYVHASPSKAAVNTLTVTEGPCPPGY